jgi:hypothetical protein
MFKIIILENGLEKEIDDEFDTEFLAELYAEGNSFEAYKVVPVNELIRGYDK